MSNSISLNGTSAKNPRKAIGTFAIAGRIAIVAVLMELFIMAAFDAIPDDASFITEAIFDAALLVAISAPLIYFWIVRPFVVAHDEAEEKIAYMAYHDALTQLANHRLLVEYLEKYLSVCERHPIFGALIFINLDGFKKINDTYGHETGDALLIEVARRLKSVTRSEDTLSRLGGDEFVILVQQLDLDKDAACTKAATIAEKICHAICEPVTYEGKTLNVGTSIGVHILGTKKVSAKNAIAEADMAMYTAKEKGGGQIVFCKN